MSSSSTPPLTFDWLRTLPGRLLILSGGVAIVLLAIKTFVALPEFLELLRKTAMLASLGALAWLTAIGIARHRRAFLWRVRRKLILSYILLGFVPVVLTGLLGLVGSVLLYGNVASYVMQDGFADLVEDIKLYAETSAGEIGRNPALVRAAIERKYTNLSAAYPALSFAVVPIATDPSPEPVQNPEPPPTAGPWRHLPPPTEAPARLAGTSGFNGVMAYVLPGAADDPHLVIRSAAPTPDGRRMVIADLPIDTDIIARLHDRTGTRIARVTVMDCGITGGASNPPPSGSALFRQTVTFMDCVNWEDGKAGRVSLSVDAPVRGLYDRLVVAQLSDNTINGYLAVLILLAVSFLVIQVAALFAGGMLARSITAAVHELFVGTERVQQGDFAHRIPIESPDQLGDLAGSFNRMSASIEHLLHVQREKQRLDDELRIAREIQKSLLPVRPPDVAGLDIADLCEPAREVGGDYYDFFVIGPRQLGVLIADVSGKGTSAALYMAELKGLMLALSDTVRSPRQLLIDVNRLLAEHLDNRSFITMTYAVIDLEAMTLSCARAGHTPLMVVSNGTCEVVTPEGMVLGLRLPGADLRFERMLEEHCRPLLPGDVIVLYTDGITEAMDTAGELFSDVSLAHVLESQHHLDAAGIRERVLRDVKAFVGDAEAHDDMTMVVLKIDGGKELS